MLIVKNIWSVGLQNGPQVEVRQSFVTSQWMCSRRNCSSEGQICGFQFFNFWSLECKIHISICHTKPSPHCNAVTLHANWISIQLISQFTRYINVSLLWRTLLVKCNALHQICSINASQNLGRFCCDSMKNELFTANCGYIPAKVNQWPKYSYLLQSLMKIIDLAKSKDYSHFHVNSSKSLAVDTKNKFGQIQFHKTFMQE